MYKRTSIRCYGKEMLCYILMSTAEEQILLVPTDETWSYYQLFHRQKIEDGTFTYTPLTSVISNEELSPTMFLKKHETLEEKRRQPFRSPSDPIHKPFNRRT